ncbi:AraC family transcriptional regulator [Bifidobacterium avesanii]|uniref:Helix-turn-helix domain-containing protein n=1 Tax=Bifidobacterium avesanii TaxID=1798157 RepID=A0A7K3TGA5_9BIFI|nr:AraC family transcriptional regulator [Bifidobacterium avesanii]KAB8294450.1 L-rhamnose operon regulatory protein rhaS [Bifidobacterium avesanii]NEG77719.1 helix-turn-helix domain-containing protein [Bifidobacterium avesanii]
MNDGRDGGAHGDERDGERGNGPIRGGDADRGADGDADRSPHKVTREWPGKVPGDSRYYIYAPSPLARGMFLCPLRVGISHYRPGFLRRPLPSDAYFLIMVLHGSLALTVGDVTRRVGQHQVAIIDCARGFQYTVEEDTEAIWLNFDGPTAPQYCGLMIDTLSNAFTPSDVPAVMTPLMDLLRLFDTQTAISEPLLSRIITDLLTACLLSGDGEATTRTRSRNIDAAIEYVSDHLDAPLTVGALARQAHMSEYHFIRLFKRQTGMTPHEYVTRERVQLAQSLLIDTAEPLPAIARECGFSDRRVLTAAFKRVVGMSPTTYRAAGRRGKTA